MSLYSHNNYQNHKDVHRNAHLYAQKFYCKSCTYENPNERKLLNVSLYF